MGMPVSVEVVDAHASQADLEAAYEYLTYVDETFSTYKATSEITRINTGQISPEQASPDMRTVFALAERTRRESNGFFDIAHNGQLDPSGVVKGWAILNAANLLRQRGFSNYYVDAGGDIQAEGLNAKSQPWRVGIRSPFNLTQIVKIIAVSGLGVATSGTYVRGQHIYNPFRGDAPITDILSLTVIGPNVADADRFATAAFAMGRDGIAFIEALDGYEGYLIDCDGIATFTTGFERFVCHD